MKRIEGYEVAGRFFTTEREALDYELEKNIRDWWYGQTKTLGYHSSPYYDNFVIYIKDHKEVVQKYLDNLVD